MDADEADPAVLLYRFIDTYEAGQRLHRARSTVSDMADKRVLTRYRVGTAVLYWGPQVDEVARALQRLRVRDAVPVPENAGRAL